MPRDLNFRDENSKRQASVYAKYSITNHVQNTKGLARYASQLRNGAWEQQNFLDNFGDSDERETA